LGESQSQRPRIPQTRFHPPHVTKAMQSLIKSPDGLLGKRIVHYPKALKAFGKWDGTAEQRLDELKQTYDAGVIIANKEASPARRLGEAKPVLEKAEMILQDIASAAGFQYEGGCGADAEDSQRVNFIFSEKPRAAFYILQMDLDECKRILADPYDPNKCDAWARVKSRTNELSGNYRYRVTWSDGSITEQPFKVLSTRNRKVEISK
jgi:hypothetical protein